MDGVSCWVATGPIDLVGWRLKQARIAVFCVSPDLDAERTLLRGVILPQLQTMLRRRFVELHILFMAEQATDPSAAGLSGELAAVAERGTFTLCVLGRRYGPLVDPLPEDVERRFWHLVPYAGRSRLELICRHLLGSPSPSAPIFAFRDRHSAAGDAASTDSSEGTAATRRLVLLKRDIREAGATVVDSGTDDLEHPRSATESLDEFGSTVLAALWQVIVGNEADLPEPSAPVYLDDNVQFTVYRAKAMRPEEWYPLLAFAHLSERRPGAPDEAPDPVAEVEAQASRLLGSRLSEFDRPRVDSRASVPHDGEITFLPHVDGVEFNPERHVFRWREDVHRAEFRMRAGAELAGRTVRGRMSVYLGAIILAEMDLAFRIDPAASPATPSTVTETAQHARPYRKIFASYSHRDTEIVRQFELLAHSLGDRYLRDVIQLRAGDPWDQGLIEMINEADVFQLFWSTHSMASPHVRREWEYAMSLGRTHFIRPTYWEDPLPSTSDPVLPPDSLRALHFHHIGAGSTPAGRLIPAAHLSPSAPLATPAPSSPTRPVPAPPPPASAYAARRQPPSGPAKGVEPGSSFSATPGPAPPASSAPTAGKPRGRSRLRTLIMPLALTVVAGAAVSTLLSQRAGGPSVIGDAPPASATKVSTDAEPTSSEPAPTASSTAPPSTTATATEPSFSASSFQPGPPPPKPSASPKEGAFPSEMSVDGAELVSGTGVSRPGTVTTVYGVGLGNQITVTVSFVSQSQEPVHVSIYARVVCLNANGEQIVASTPADDVEVVPVNKSADPDRGPVRWTSEDIAIPLECASSGQFDGDDGIISVVGTTTLNPSGTLIRAAFDLW
jgi:hypothetical protein